MKPRILFYFMIFALILSSAHALEKGPVAVSPGSDAGVARIGGSCPTFSWTAVEWAACYKIAVFQASSPEVLAYEEMEALSSPLLSKKIQGRALSWTPTSDERLGMGRMYVWYVRAEDTFGQGIWSAGRMFRVEAAATISRMEETVKERLREHGVSEEAIAEILEDLEENDTETSYWGVESDQEQTSGGVVIQGNEVGSNTWYGDQAGDKLDDPGSDGIYNSLFGSLSGFNLTDGNSNTFIGRSAGYSNTFGSGNTFVGVMAGEKNTFGIIDEYGLEARSNTFIGSYAGRNNTFGYNNTFIGTDAGNKNETGSDNVSIGINAGHENVAGVANVFLGEEAGRYSTGSLNVFLGGLAGRNNSWAGGNTFVGFRAGYNNTLGITDDGESSRKNTFVGREAGRYNTSGHSNTFIGDLAGNKNTIGQFNTFLGTGAGVENTWAQGNTFIGSRAGEKNCEGVGEDDWLAHYNTFVGNSAGRFNTSGYWNTFIGAGAGYGNTWADGNTFIGASAGVNNTMGITDNGYFSRNNTFIGQNAGELNTSGFINTFIGNHAGHNNETGGANVYLGRSAGYSNTSNCNVYIGESAGYNNITGFNNIFLGYRAGYNETEENRLYIENSSSSSPLIYGEFDNDILTINGKLGIGTQSPAYQMELETTGENAILLLDRTDGAKTGFSASGDKCAFGTLTNHPLWMVINGAFNAIFHTDGSLQMMNGAWCTAAGKWQDASSRELKENVRNLTLEEAKQALDGLDPIRFNYKADKEDESLGFIAEDVPELVASKDRKSMSAMDVVAVLTKVVQEQQKAISELRKQIEELKSGEK